MAMTQEQFQRPIARLESFASTYSAYPNDVISPVGEQGIGPTVSDLQALLTAYSELQAQNKEWEILRNIEFNKNILLLQKLETARKALEAAEDDLETDMNNSSLFAVKKLLREALAQLNGEVSS